MKKVEAMPEPWKSHFPMTDQEAVDWKPLFRLRPLARQVLCVAKTRIEGAWSAYCDAVPGMDHFKEYQEVALHGDKMDEKVARALFPYLDGIPYAN